MKDVKDCQAVVLAAGKSTRFGTGRSKLLEMLCGKPLICHTLDPLIELDLPIVVVIGHEGERLIKTLSEWYPHHPFEYALQHEQKGTGHALLTALPFVSASNVLVLNGDMPLVTAHLLEAFLQKHADRGSDASFVGTYAPEGCGIGYGRILAHESGYSIIEERDFVPLQDFGYADFKKLPCNAGIYLFSTAFANPTIRSIQASQLTGELYITSLIERAPLARGSFSFFTEFDNVRGVNTLEEYEVAQRLVLARKRLALMKAGVRIDMPHTVYIEEPVRIGAGTVINAGAQLRGSTIIGQNCTIGAYSHLDKALLADRVTVHTHSVINDSALEEGAQVGPFAHVTGHAVIGKGAVIGNFVEVKRSVIGALVKAKHLAYLGDAQVGTSANIGGGTITANHDGVKKHATIIGQGAYIGSNCTLVAPLEIGAGAFTAGGSVITENVPALALALGRARQVIKENYTARKAQRAHEGALCGKGGCTRPVQESCANSAAVPCKKNQESTV